MSIFSYNFVAHQNDTSHKLTFDYLNYLQKANEALGDTAYVLSCCYQWPSMKTLINKFQSWWNNVKCIVVLVEDTNLNSNVSFLWCMLVSI